MRTTLTSVLVSVLAVALVTSVLAQPAPVRRGPVTFEDPLTARLLQLTPVQLSQRFGEILKTKGVTGEQADQAAERFRLLPQDLQGSIILTLDDDLAKRADLEMLSISRLDARTLKRIVAFKLFMISSFWPEQGQAGSWAYAFGRGFDEDCNVFLDGTQVESHYVGMSFGFFPDSMAFRVPAEASRGQEHDVYVRNTDSGDDTGTVKYVIVAPRGYRGYHGWRFSNFSRPTIDWKLYAHYFGASNVEYADGTHRPAAQAWYNSAYTSAGNGGNCYGMSVSSLRVKNSEFDHMFHASFFQGAATAQSSVWRYDWDDATRETVQQQQGAWYTQELLDVHNNLWNNQTPRDLFTRCESLLNNAVNRPVLVYWGPNWGHVVCPYETEVDGNTRRIICYDNNNPYRENEGGPIDPDVATVDWGANTFSRGSAGKGEMFSYEECTPPNPHLPGAEYGGPGSDTVVAVFSHSADIQQITDENGRTFFNADGSINENAASRIPLSSYLLPLVQLQPRVIGGPRDVRTGQLQMAQLKPPADAPHIFVFGEAQGKSLTFNIAGQGAKQMDLFSRGRIFSINSNGIGQVRASNIHELPTLQILNAQATGPTSMAFIRSTPAGDRVFELNNLRNLGAQQLELVPNAEGTAIEVNGPANLQFNMDVLGPVGQGMQQATFANIALQAGAKANLTPVNWGALQNTNLRLQMLNLQNNAVIDQQTLERIR